MKSPSNPIYANPFRQTGKTWIVEFQLPFKAVESFSEGLEALCHTISSFEDDPAYVDRESEPETRWKLSLYCETQPDEVAIRNSLILLAAANNIPAPELSTFLLPEHDWVSEVQKSFPPIDIRRYFIHCSSYTGHIPYHSHVLNIDAGLAFGTGEHETTKGCLYALHLLAKQYSFDRMLDMGCGTGILAIAMVKTWKRPVIAADLEPTAVSITSRNARLNGVMPWVKSYVSNGYRARVIGQHAPYDLITANILARPLMQFAPDLKAHLAPGGIAVLSGLLIQQENQVLAHHRALGLTLLKRLHFAPWSVLILQRP